MKQVAALQDSVNSVAGGVAKPTSGNQDFTCTIFSLENKRTKEDMSDKLWASVKNPDSVTSYPGVKVYDTATHADGAATSDQALEETVKGFRTVHEFFKTVFNRNSIDGQGMEIRASIHLGRGYDNAFWSEPASQMYFGDGGSWDGQGWLLVPEDPKTYDEWWHDDDEATFFAKWHAYYGIDIVAHELTHGIVSCIADLGTRQWSEGCRAQWPSAHKAAYSEAATLNEHVADCFGVMVKHFSTQQTADAANWEIGADMWARWTMVGSRWTANYMRTFGLPDADSADAASPRHWRERKPFDDGSQFGLDPHVNCGIASHAFYLAAKAFGGCSWETVGQIWYHALVDPRFRDPRSQTFAGWRDLTVSHAGKICGSHGWGILVDAWKQVGL